MRKEEIRGLIVGGVVLAVAIIVILAFISPAMRDNPPQHLSAVIFLLVTALTAYLFNAIGLELLHLIGAKAGGYNVTLFNVLFFCFYKVKNEWKFHFRDFDGVCGEIRTTPKKEKLNPNLICWFPLFGYAVEVATCIVIMQMVEGAGKEFTAKWLIPASIIFLLVSSLIALYNLVPLKLDIMTDGYRIRLFSKPINIEAYNQMLVIQEKQRIGEKVENIPVFSEITEYTAEINTLALLKNLEEEKLKEAEEIADTLIENKSVLNIADYNRLVAQKLYIVALTRPLEEAKKIYDEICPVETRRFIANDNRLPTIRAYITIAGLIEGSESEVGFAKDKIEKAKKKTNASVIFTEEKLIESALQKVYVAHSDWKKE